jgi:hypothetical protein
MDAIMKRGGFEMRTIWKPVAIISLVALLGLPSQGRAQWRLNGVPVAALAGVQNSAQIVADGEGGAFIVWMDYRNPSNLGDIYMQRIDSRGEAYWADGGIAVADGTSLQKWPTIALDSYGNAIVAYIDGSDVRVQRVNRSGSLLFSHDGVTVYASALYPGVPRVAAGLRISTRNASPLSARSAGTSTASLSATRRTTRARCR